MSRAERLTDRQTQAELDMRSVMASPEGRRLVWRLIDETAQTLGGSFVQDSHVTAFNEGRRSVGIELMRRAQEWAPNEFMRALQEALTERQQAKLDTPVVSAED